MLVDVKHLYTLSSLDENYKKKHINSCKENTCPVCYMIFNESISNKVKTITHIYTPNNVVGLITVCVSCKFKQNVSVFTVDSDSITYLPYDINRYK